MNKKKFWILIGSGIAIVLVIALVVVLVVMGKNKPVDNPDEAKDNGETSQLVEPEQAQNMYKETMNTCDGVLVWDLQVGDTVPVDDMNAVSDACQKDNYYSKMIGHTYDLENNVIIHVNVLKKDGSKLYKLDNTFVADYSEETLDDSLNFGTTYEYVYQNNGDTYKLIRVQLMAPIPDEEPEETEE